MLNRLSIRVKGPLDIAQFILGQANINSQELRDFIFPIPPLNIQKKIARKIGDIKDEIKRLRQDAVELREKAIKEFEEEIFNN